MLNYLVNRKKEVSLELSLVIGLWDMVYLREAIWCPCFLSYTLMTFFWWQDANFCWWYQTHEQGRKSWKLLLEAGFRFISSSWMMQRHKSSSCLWEVKSLRAHRLLGFWLDFRLDWNCHVAQVCKKLLRGIHLLSQLVRAITSDHMLKIYHALFHSHVAYGVFL